MRVTWATAALDGIADVYDYLYEFNPRAAMQVAQTLLNTGNSLEHFPHRGRPVGTSDLRELVTSYPYIIRYRISGEAVVILRVRHGSRWPTDPWPPAV